MLFVLFIASSRFSTNIKVYCKKKANYFVIAAAVPADSIGENF